MTRSNAPRSPAETTSRPRRIAGPTRRTLLSGTAMSLGLMCLALRAAAEAPLELKWSDLVPAEAGGGGDVMTRLGIVEHGQMSMPEDDDEAAGRGAMVTKAYNGRTVALPGFLIPLDYSGLGATAFILVPYVGACIHVPPPPPNQLVYVTIETPYATTELFEPVTVTGAFNTHDVETELAEIGYAIVADRIDPYDL